MQTDLFDNEFNEYYEDFDKEKQDDKEINIADLLNTKITYKTKNMDIESILNSLKRGDYILPKYQRKFVWDKNQVSNLILSLIKNIPIPAIYLYYHPESGKYVILDGQQRITSLFMYYRNIFYRGSKERKRIDFRDIALKVDEIDEIKESLSVTDTSNISIHTDERKSRIKEIYRQMEEQYNICKAEFNLKTGVETRDITFENFDEKAKRILRRKDLETVFVQCDGENSNKVYSDIFKLLNSAGKELSSQEIRNGVYYNNALYDYIDIINTSNQVWRSIYGGNSLIFKDFEYLLRFLALDHFSVYKKDAKPSQKFKIMYHKTFSYSNIIDDISDNFNYTFYKDESNPVSKNKEMSQDNQLIKQKADKQVEKLRRFFDLFTNVKETKGRSLLIMEALFLSFSKLGLLDSDIKIDYQAFFSKINLKDFNISTSTSNKGTIEQRVNKAIEIVRKEYDGV